jgi:hypothetical protein
MSCSPCSYFADVFINIDVRCRPSISLVTHRAFHLPGWPIANPRAFPDRFLNSHPPRCIERSSQGNVERPLELCVTPLDEIKPIVSAGMTPSPGIVQGEEVDRPSALSAVHGSNRGSVRSTQRQTLSTPFCLSLWMRLQNLGRPCRWKRPGTSKALGPTECRSVPCMEQIYNIDGEHQPCVERCTVAAERRPVWIDHRSPFGWTAPPP